MRLPPLRIAFGAVFWRIFLLAFAIQQFIAFNKARHLFHGQGLRRQLAGFAEFSPYALTLALLVAAAATLALDLLVRWVVRAAVGWWYHPRAGAAGTALGFHLEPGERLLRDGPARRRQQYGWRPGTLVLTDRRLAFYDANWHDEPDVFNRRTLVSLRCEPNTAPRGSFLLGIPGRLIVRDSEGRETSLAVADPAEILSWFQRPDLAVPGLPVPLLISAVPEPSPGNAKAPLAV
jgi:hypothetical protein